MNRSKEERVMVDEEKLQNLRKKIEDVKKRNEKNIDSLDEEFFIESDLLRAIEEVKSKHYRSMLEIIDKIEEIIGDL